ncbi:hypothetical protein P4233_01710 [Pseudomonas aeruginosa]|nr:hypothetical protein [Pseudomonas aeruginosa]
MLPTPRAAWWIRCALGPRTTPNTIALITPGHRGHQPPRYPGNLKASGSLILGPGLRSRIGLLN